MRGTPPIPARRSFSLVEVVVSVLIMGVMFVAALNTVGAARGGEYRLAEREQALLLAQALMAEILQQAYIDAAGAYGTWGLGSAEVTGTRSEFDDVDDYDDWQASPPQNKDGTPIAWAGDFGHAVDVAWVTAGNLSQTSSSETGIKRIVVTVTRGGRTLVSLTAFRTEAWRDPLDVLGAHP
ncbi:MAG: prepilin-type N-terminal cleavage/methylation domain-containing protein [Phycisphaerae bacterium]|nr:prepilin-type N-terminal cleavage/methylation domain-containing protein [Phycisphaerae bacterium]HQL53942.1 prepilin-type N-terminal cleavage/methylation domain-containing protein [Phycisphaerae bacterium]